MTSALKRLNNMYISDIYFMLLARGIVQVTYTVVAANSAIVLIGENVPNCFEEFRDEVNHSRADMHQNTLFA